MLKRILILLILALTQVGCDVDYGENHLDILHPWNLEEVRSRLEQEKREFLKIEDLQIGNGAIASWRRRLKAEIEVRYADDGTTIYKGPIVTYFGFNGLLPDYRTPLPLTPHVSPRPLPLALRLRYTSVYEY